MAWAPRTWAHRRRKVACEGDSEWLRRVHCGSMTRQPAPILPQAYTRRQDRAPSCLLHRTKSDHTSDSVSHRKTVPCSHQDVCATVNHLLQGRAVQNTSPSWSSVFHCSYHTVRKLSGSSSSSDIVDWTFECTHGRLLLAGDQRPSDVETSLILPRKSSEGL